MSRLPKMPPAELVRLRAGVEVLEADVCRIARAVAGTPLAGDVDLVAHALAALAKRLEIAAHEVASLATPTDAKESGQ